MIQLGTPLVVGGCFIQEKSIAGRTLAEIEMLLGFHQGRFRDGIDIVALCRIPHPDDFDLAAYTNLVTLVTKIPEGLDAGAVKARCRQSWAIAGPERIVKVLPALRRDLNVNPDIQAPFGHGVPQWLARVPIPGRVAALVRGYPDARYSPGY